MTEPVNFKVRPRRVLFVASFSSDGNFVHSETPVQGRQPLAIQPDHQRWFEEVVATFLEMIRFDLVHYGPVYTMRMAFFTFDVGHWNLTIACVLTKPEIRLRASKKTQESDSGGEQQITVDG